MYTEICKEQILFLTGEACLLDQQVTLPVRRAFDPDVCRLLDALSRRIAALPQCREYPDLAAFAFWCRSSHLKELARPYQTEGIRLGRGCVLHICPGNVAMNAAYSLVAGLLAGNANAVKLASGQAEAVSAGRLAFGQAGEISAGRRASGQAEAVSAGRRASGQAGEAGQADRTALVFQTLDQLLQEAFPELRPYVVCFQCAHEHPVLRELSASSEARMIWGGDETVRRLKELPTPPRGQDLAFADRVSACVIDAGTWLGSDEKEELARRFAADVWWSGQQACSSPSAVAWLGTEQGIAQASVSFWACAEAWAEQYAPPAPISSVKKWEAACMAAVACKGEGVKLEARGSRILRVSVPCTAIGLLPPCPGDGFFWEMRAETPEALLPLLNGKCQTIVTIGAELKEFLLAAGPRGVDRIVAPGNSMNFSLLWDGMDLIRQLSREIVQE